MVEVFEELADADAAYDQLARSNFEDRAGRLTGVTVTDTAGWWESGMFLEWVQEYPDTPLARDPEIANIAVGQLIRHENLVVNGYLKAQLPTDDVDQAFGFLHDLERALFDEAVEHLTLTEE